MFLPYNEDDRKLTNKDEIRQHLKNAYINIYKVFRPRMNSVGYSRVSFHSFRRHVYSTITSLTDQDYADYVPGHENSPYWDKPESKLVATWKRIEPYLTYVDIEGLETKQRD
jgi:hypothetical protein